MSPFSKQCLTQEKVKYMKTNVVTNLDKSPILTINPELARELEPLEPEQSAVLEEMILRDGVTDPIKYWIAPDGQAEIIDGHNRYRIAMKHHRPFATAEVKFEKHYTITAVKYWMHKTQAGRRDGSRRLARMAELLSQLKIEAGQETTKAAIHREVATDANTSPQAVKKAEQRQSKGNAPKPVKTPLERILELFEQLSDADRETLRRAIEKPSG